MSFLSNLRLMGRLGIVLLAVVLVPGCMKDNKSMDNKSMDKPMMDKPLYERLGGEKAISAVVDDFVGRAAKDEKVNFFRKGTGHEWKPSDAEVAAFKKSLVAFIAQATGGPKMYQGRDMKSAHAGMMISNAEFDALAGDLTMSLDSLGVPAKEKGELLAIVGTTRSSIVEKN